MPQWLVVTQQQVADTDTYRDVMMRVWYHSTQGVSDSSNSFSTSGAHTPNLSGVSVNINVPGSGGQGASQLIHERTTRINKSYGSSTSVYAAAWLSGIEYWGASQEIYANHTYTVPARAYAAPTAPNNVSVSRNSDTSQTVSWSRRATTAGRYQSQRVQRRSWDGSSWSAWATVHTISTNYTNNGNHTWTDTGTVANRNYQYRVQAINSTATTSSATTSNVYTTPGAPSTVTAALQSSGDIRLRITPTQPSNAVDFVIEQSVDSGPWAALAQVPGSQDVSDWTHTSPPPAGSRRYRVAVRITASAPEAGGGLQSGWRESNTVQLAAPPNAPTGLGPSTPHDATEPRTLRWTHNPVDSSDQEAFQVRHRISGGSWVTESAVTSDFSEWVLPADTYANGSTVEWEVRTRGQHASYSPYSATASFVTSARPTPSIDSPEEDATVADSTAALAWTYYQEQDSPQAQWRATLLTPDERVLEVRSGSGTTSSVTFQVPVEDGEAYVGRVEVASAVGLWSEPTDVHFNVAYPMPALVDLEVAWHREAGVTSLELSPQTWDGVDTIEPVAVTVHRSTDGGESWQVVARELPIGGGITSLIDTTVPTRADVLYRATTISALPSMAVGEPVAISIDERTYAYLGYGPGFADILVFYGNLSLTSQAARQKALEHFAGRDRGVVITGQARTLDVGVSVSLLRADGMATREDFEEAAHAGGTVLLRGPDARVIEGAMSAVSTTTQYAPIDGVQFTVSEADNG